MGKKPLLDKHTLRGSLMLLMTSFIWGTAFLAQSVGMDHVGPFTFNAVRSYIGVLVLLPVIFWFRRSRSPFAVSKTKNRKKLWSCVYPANTGTAEGGADRSVNHHEHGVRFRIACRMRYFGRNHNRKGDLRLAVFCLQPYCWHRYRKRTVSVKKKNIQIERQETYRENY